jgi:hypothetical protein
VFIVRDIRTEVLLDCFVDGDPMVDTTTEMTTGGT